MGILLTVIIEIAIVLLIHFVFDFKKMSKVGFLRVGTSHHQSIDRLGKNLMSIAEAEDGVIEMIEVKNYPLIATQFHPERSKDGEVIFNAFRKLVHLHRA